MNGQLAGLLVCGSLSAVVAGVVSLLLAGSTGILQHGPEIRPPENAAQAAYDAVSRLDALSREFDEFRRLQLGADSRIPVDGFATRSELNSLISRIEVLSKEVKELRDSYRDVAILDSLSKWVFARPGERDLILEDQAKEYGLSEVQRAQMRELETHWEMRDRNLLLICERAGAGTMVQTIESHEAEYQAAFEEILTSDQREKRRRTVDKHGIWIVSRYSFVHR